MISHFASPQETFSVRQSNYFFLWQEVYFLWDDLFLLLLWVLILCVPTIFPVTHVIRKEFVVQENYHLEKDYQKFVKYSPSPTSTPTHPGKLISVVKTPTEPLGFTWKLLYTTTATKVAQKNKNVKTENVFLSAII